MCRPVSNESRPESNFNRPIWTRCRIILLLCCIEVRSARWTISLRPQPNLAPNWHNYVNVWLNSKLPRSTRQQAEEQLIASEVRYRRLFESAKDGILILDADTGLVADVNPFLIEMLGYSQTAFLGKKIWELGSFQGQRRPTK